MIKKLLFASIDVLLTFLLLRAVIVLCPFFLLQPAYCQAMPLAKYDKALSAVQASKVITICTSEFTYTVKTINVDGVDLRDDSIDADTLALGNAFTWGPGVENEETWPEVLEGPGINVINAGMARGSTISEARLLEWLAPKLPQTDGYPYRVIVAFSPDDVEQEYDQGLGLGMGPYAPTPDMAFVDIDQDDLQLRLAKENPVLLKEIPPALDEGWLVTQQALLDIQAQCADLPSELLVAIIPTKEQVYWKYLAPHIEAHRYDPNLPNNLIREFCQQSGIKVLDLAPEFQARNNMQLYWNIDDHWNAEGHYLAAWLIGEKFGYGWGTSDNHWKKVIDGK